MDYLGGSSVAGGKLKEAGTSSWNSPNTDATNTSLFTGLPGGHRLYFGDDFNFGGYSYWWSTTENFSGNAWGRRLEVESGNTNRDYGNKRDGYSVRCLRD